MKYYLHDSTAFSDEKVTLLYLKFGFEAIGLFYIILEKLALQEQPINEIVLKSQLNIKKRLQKQLNFMYEIGILSLRNGDVFNENLLSYSQKYQIKKEKTRKRVSEWRKNQDNTKNVTGYKHVRNTDKDKISKDKENIKEIILYLNSKSGKNFKFSTEKTKKLIKLRLTEFCIEDFKIVIDNKISDWKNNPDMDKFLRPETLFGNKFEGYLNENTIKDQSVIDKYKDILSSTDNEDYKCLIELKKDILYTFDSVITLTEYDKLDLNGKANKPLFISFQSYGKNKKDFLNNLYIHAKKY